MSFSTFLKSSIGNKLLMSFTGLFLILFLIVHLAGNLQLLIDDGGEAFVAYSEIMGSNLLIKFVAYALYIAILLHTYKGIMIWLENRRARGNVRYAVKSSSGTPWASRNMIWLGSLIFIFIAIHMSNFWYKFKFTDVHEAEHYTIVQESFKQLWIVAFYVLGQVVLGWHLLHGFQSAFQTLGLRSGKYYNVVNNIGIAFSIIVPLLFAIIPIFMYMDIYPLPEFRVIPGQ